MARQTSCLIELHSLGLWRKVQIFTWINEKGIYIEHQLASAMVLVAVVSSCEVLVVILCHKRFLGYQIKVEEIFGVWSLP